MSFFISLWLANELEYTWGVENVLMVVLEWSKMLTIDDVDDD